MEDEFSKYCIGIKNVILDYCAETGIKEQELMAALGWFISGFFVEAEWDISRVKSWAHQIVAVHEKHGKKGDICKD